MLDIAISTVSKDDMSSANVQNNFELSSKEETKICVLENGLVF